MSETPIEVNSPTGKALALAGMGFKVFPCKGDKTPATLHGHLDATDDETIIRVMFAAAGVELVGISCPGSHIHVLDVDPAGMAWFEEQRALGLVPDTVEITTRRGGLHLFFLADDPGLVVKQGACGGIDVRSGNEGHGGYVIAWGEASEYRRDRMSGRFPMALWDKRRMSVHGQGQGSNGQAAGPASGGPASSGFGQLSIANRIRLAAQKGFVPAGEQDNFLIQAYGHAARAVVDGVAGLEEALAWCGRVNCRWIKPFGDKDFAGKIARVGLCSDRALTERYEKFDDELAIEPFGVNVTARAQRVFPDVAAQPSADGDPFAGFDARDADEDGPVPPWGEPVEPHPLSRFVDMDTALGVPEYLLTEFMGVGLVTVAGARGKGKTTALVSVGLLMAGLGLGAGTALIPSKDRWRNVVYVTEDVRQVRGILHMQEVKEGLDGGSIRTRFKVVEAVRMSVAKFVEVAVLYEQALTRWVPDRHGRPVEIKPVVMVDTKSACFDVEDEDSNTEASRIAAMIKQRFRGLPCVMIGHVRKADHEKTDELTMRGAGAMEADANQCLYLIEKEDGVRYLVRGKTRFEGKWVGLEIETSVAGVALVDRFGDTVVTQVRWGRVRPMTAMPTTKAGKIGPGHLRQALKALDTLVQKGNPPDAAAQSQTNRFSHVLTKEFGWSDALARKVVVDLWAKHLVMSVPGGPRQKGMKHAPRNTTGLSEEGKNYLLGVSDFNENPF